MPDSAVDILENTIRRHGDLLDVLLLDRTRTTKRKSHNILWATDSYVGHNPKQEISILDITGTNTYLIQPRIAKSKEEQKSRTKDKAEVFTPKNIVSQMNRQVDWSSGNWPADESNWKDYVKELRLEITCGEAPFIVGRYNAASGKKVLKLSDRVGFLDRKLQVVGSYCNDKKEWLEWAIVAFQCSYGYEWQGDNLLLARENLLYTFIDYWNDKFPNDKINLDRKISKEKMEMLLRVAEIISWNIFQMDGIKNVIPMSCCHEVIEKEIPPMIKLWGESPKIIKNECAGCKNNDHFKHNGKYVFIMDWEKGKSVKFVNLMKAE